ncbi:MAG: bifunctional diaminohydroxyphosphoribosylaminopyrimidine deaminase/5-amino-6-(5-phosphoribosylamino)uracil reductase RibD [Candidatus Thiosymbion ectosymbiont of Robbea hypermnestra]|nr:bifunctional diaminohydroxyphosphoribosylaminopyrimidine deaminase/5-amino-6-(5-phosphoribosylamino)uracil reductase RibD [Candidatus Thiosymbion ectosymbiont of Robbea hypermnestra]
MARALRLARLGLFTTDPNPRVGCVLVRAGEIVGEGYHRRAGAPHAERLALAAAGERATGATAYVTLEPCCHQGRTPPCTDALLGAGVRRVVAAMADPNPLVAGRGLESLKAAGVAVRVGVLEAEARALNPGFIKRMRRGLPFVRCKLAASLDGRTAMTDGESKWITSAAARRDVQFLRARSSAILTGSGTLLADDPILNVRLTAEELPGLEPGEPVRQPLRVLVDSRLRTPTNARLLGQPGGATLIAGSEPTSTAGRRLEAAGAEIYPCAGRAGRVDLESLLRYLARREINEVQVEAGPTLSGALLRAGLVDELVLYLAPHLMGDAARGLFRLPGLTRMRDRIGLDIRDLRLVGPDLRITAIPLTTKNPR